MWERGSRRAACIPLTVWITSETVDPRIFTCHWKQGTLRRGCVRVKWHQHIKQGRSSHTHTHTDTLVFVMLILLFVAREMPWGRGQRVSTSCVVPSPTRERLPRGEPKKRRGESDQPTMSTGATVQKVPALVHPPPSWYCQSTSKAHDLRADICVPLCRKNEGSFLAHIYYCYPSPRWRFDGSDGLRLLLSLRTRGASSLKFTLSPSSSNDTARCTTAHANADSPSNRPLL